MLDNFISEPFLGFEEDSLKFLSKLKNKRFNNKEWFDKNRKIYEESLKLPMRSLLENINDEVLKFEPRIVISNKSIFRINRDIRFKKDKTPYKHNYSAAFTYDRIKTPEIPQFYFHISQDEFLFASGQYSTETSIIKSIRKRIYEDKDKFLEIINEKEFKKTFKQVTGDMLTKIPSEYRLKENNGFIEKYLKMKQFYVYKTYSPEIVLSSSLKDIITENVSITNNFNKFLFDSIK